MKDVGRWRVTDASGVYGKAAVVSGTTRCNSETSVSVQRCLVFAIATCCDRQRRLCVSHTTTQEVTGDNSVVLFVLHILFTEP